MSFVRVVALMFSVLAMCPPALANQPPITQLAVLLNYDAPGVTRAEELVSLLRTDSADPQSSVLRARFQNPKSSRLLITNRLLPKFRDTLPRDHPDELLHRYLLLDFPDEATTTAAKGILERDPFVKFVKQPGFVEFSVAPSDPYYSLAPRIQDYQWAINDPLGLQQAWNKVRGTAFLVDIDNGVQASPLHPDLSQAFRRFNWNIDTTTNVDEMEDPTAPGAGHGTATAGIMAGATAQSNVPPGYPNPASAGIAGVCWYCNLMVAKVSEIQGGAIFISTSYIAKALNWASNSGAQVANMSFGTDDLACATNPNDELCLAVDSAARKEVVIVAAAGNSNKHAFPGATGNGIGADLDFPARDSRTIAVGAIQSYTGSRGNLWTEETPVGGFYGSSGGPGMTTRGILAPGRDVLSSAYSGRDWNANIRCGTALTFPGGAQGTSYGPSYGVCTGTSIATPHITGAVGLLRSINPLMTVANIRTYLLNSGDNASSPNTTRGFGVPNIGTAVDSILATTNRLTPLFSLYSNDAWDYFYSVVPQQGRAAISAQLLPFPVGATSGTFYSVVGTFIPAYGNFPDSISRPEAEVWIFSTFVNPANPNVELTPLYRLSWRCGDGAQSVCGINPNHVSHFYTADLSEAQSYISGGFSFDAIEGYVYPTSQSQPPGTVALMRAYNQSRDGYAMFPEDLQSSYASQGYTLLLSTVGYAYRNNGSFPTY